jgi:hypothetical protein
VDTGRVTSSGAIARVWLRFDHHQTMPKMESTTGPWSRMEAETDLDCEARKARDVTLRLMDSTGTVVGDTTWGLGEWQPFQEHALGIHILQPACEALGKGRAA